jgi:hypothetical protein
MTVGCTKENPTLGKWKLMFRILEHDKNAKLITPEDMQSGIKCSDFGPGCNGAHMARVINLEVIFLQYDSIESAREEAKRINGYYIQNWVLDDFTGEPSLERFAVNKLKAIKGRKAKKIPQKSDKKEDLKKE